MMTLKWQISVQTNSEHQSAVCELYSLCRKAYAESKKEKLPFAPPEQPASEDEDPVPDELICMICHELLSDAVVIPCCGNNFCDDCESQLHTHVQIIYVLMKI